MQKTNLKKTGEFAHFLIYSYLFRQKIDLEERKSFVHIFYFMILRVLTYYTLRQKTYLGEIKICPIFNLQLFI